MLVTGAAGFIGTLYNKLVELGHEVHTLDVDNSADMVGDINNFME